MCGPVPTGSWLFSIPPNRRCGRAACWSTPPVPFPRKKTRGHPAVSGRRAGLCAGNARVSFGRKADGMDAVRIYPMDGGEGHFAAKLRRVSENPDFPGFQKLPPEKGEGFTLARALLKEIFNTPPEGALMKSGNRFTLLPGSYRTVPVWACFAPEWKWASRRESGWNRPMDCLWQPSGRAAVLCGAE